MGEWFSIVSGSRELGVRPRVLSDLFYHQYLVDGAHADRIGGRRLISRPQLERIREVLQERGYLPAEVSAS